MTKNKYPHFNPDKYNLPVKIATVKSSCHSKHNINYHIIWIPKYRRKVLVRNVWDILSRISKG
ncbi:hypothetical protein GF327_04730 [Candidatus Woesearchaeota archaeon]|nr:hypothetical protein [Candidatus Woesearchaeota archaeon]